MKIIFVILATVICVFMSSLACGKGEKKSDSIESVAQSAASSATVSGSVTIKMEGSTGKYKYNPGNLNINSGETVSFKLIGDEELHTFTVEGLGIDWSLSPKETKDVSFTFKKSGSYNIKCLPHPEMTGVLNVQ